MSLEIYVQSALGCDGKLGSSPRRCLPAGKDVDPVTSDKSLDIVSEEACFGVAIFYDPTSARLAGMTEAHRRANGVRINRVVAKLSEVVNSGFKGRDIVVLSIGDRSNDVQLHNTSHSSSVLLIGLECGPYIVRLCASNIAVISLVTVLSCSNAGAMFTDIFTIVCLKLLY